MFSISNAYGDVSYVATTTARAVIREGSLLTSPLLFAFFIIIQIPLEELASQKMKLKMLVNLINLYEFQ